jgi:hypothetical protein
MPPLGPIKSNHFSCTGPHGVTACWAYLQAFHTTQTSVYFTAGGGGNALTHTLHIYYRLHILWEAIHSMRLQLSTVC